MDENIDPIKLAKMIWPDLVLYDKQAEIIYSVFENDETFASAGNQLGKDFISAVVAVLFFVTRTPARVVTTSVKEAQLKDVLWGEIRRLIDISAVELPFYIKHLEIRKVRDDGTLEPRSHIVGQVVQQGESLLGRHLEYVNGKPTTLCIFDESSGIMDDAYNAVNTWSHSKLIIGNPFPCTNFFYRGVTGGDIPRDNGKGFHRKVIKIKAVDSPNVRLAEAEIAAGKEPSGRILIPGVKTYSDYLKHRKLWDPMHQAIGLDAEFYEGAEIRLFPSALLLAAAALPSPRASVFSPGELYLGVDPAEGGDSSSWTIVCREGVIDQVSLKTPDTSLIPAHTIALMESYGIPAQNVYFDRGGGGKQHADYLRKRGYDVATVAFGESVKLPRRRGMTSLEKRNLADEEQYSYKNRRAQMYGILSRLINPSLQEEGESIFSINGRFTKIHEQLRPIPLQYDAEGRMYLPPKHKTNPNSKEVTLVELIGHSPDEADSLVLATYAMMKPSTNNKIGVM